MGVTVVRTALTAETAVTRARASVVIVAPVAETSAALLAAATSVSIANAVVTAVVPVGSLSYILMATAAYLDTSGRFQYFPDEVFVTDATFRVVGKTLTETFASTDYITSKSSNLVKTDSISTPDFVIRTLEFIRRYTDTFGFTERLTFTFARPVTDSFTLSDSPVRNFSKRTTDAFGFTDYSLLLVSKSNTDSVAVLDSVSRDFTKSKADSISLTDSNTRAVSKLLSDAFAFTELVSRSLTRTIQDGFAMNDTADLADGITYQTVKYINNLAFVTDANALSSSLGKTDTVTLVSAGLLTSQNYCDMSYFAEDYVGQSRTFS